MQEENNLQTFCIVTLVVHGYPEADVRDVGELSVHARIEQIVPSSIQEYVVKAVSIIPTALCRQ